MANYDYKCPTCSFVDSIHMKISDDLPVTCLKCFKDGNECNMQKQVSKPSVHFKGSGFYETDYKNK